jgi:hypothetical protein
LPLRGRWTQSGHIVPLLWQRITCIPTIDISRSDVTPALSMASIRCDVTFSQLYTPCSSETKDVITSKYTYLRMLINFINRTWICNKNSNRLIDNSRFWNGQFIELAVQNKCGFQHCKFLISNFRRVLNAVCFLLGNSPASEFYMPTFRNTLSVPSSQAGRRV